MFADNLKKLRIENNLTQAALGEKCNVSNVTVYKWEVGKNEPDIASIVRLSEALGVTADELLGCSDVETPCAEANPSCCDTAGAADIEPSGFRRCRECAKLTQKEAAVALGVSVQTISYWETGRKLPSADKLGAIADVYGTSIDNLFGHSCTANSGAVSDFAERLHKLRKMCGLSQEAISEQLGTTYRTYGSWERGEREPKFQTLCAIADYFCVTTDELLGRASPSETNAEASQQKDEDSVQSFAPPDRLRNALETFIRQIVRQELDC